VVSVVRQEAYLAGKKAVPFITGPPTHIVGARLVTAVGVCRL